MGAAAIPTPSFGTANYPVDATNASSFTIPATFGSAAGNRRIFVVVCPQLSTARAINSVTIGGVAATIHANSGSGTRPIAIASAIVPTGTSGNIGVVLSGAAAYGCQLYVYPVYDLTRDAPQATYSNTATATAISTGALNVPAGGILLAGVFRNYTSGDVPSWSGPTVDANVGVDNTVGRQSVAKLQSDAGGSVTATATFPNSLATSIVALTWR